MRSNDIQISLRDDSHPEVVEGPGEECSEGRGEGDGSIPARYSDTNTDHVLFADEALNKPNSE